ncbi:MAG TPA: DEAD/DEAH box helicase [Leucothrix mucor]|nr:DEAD/DEAH box helicase [Leucothrix mucor]
MYNKSLTTTNAFSQFGFSSAILTAINEAAYEQPTDIQKVAIPRIQDGRDVLAGAETGSGKTAAFVLPVLNALTQTVYGKSSESVRPQQVRVLILVPTRELAIQIGQEITRFSAHIEPPVKCLSIYGGVKIEQPVKALRGGVDFVVATPGRFLDLINAKVVKFNQLQVLILDEVDRLVATGFKEEVEQILKSLPNKRQNLFFTATFPDEIRPLVRKVLDNPEIIKLDKSNKSLIDQRVLTVNFDRKTALLTDLLKNNDWSQVLIFCSAKRSCDKLVAKLAAEDITAFSLHGNKKQHERRNVLKEFKTGNIRVLIATDVAARGLDIAQLPCVINYELPRSPNDYVHRIGRTGRAGEQGIAISLISHHEYQHFIVIEKRNGFRLQWEAIPGFEADEIAPPPPSRSKPKKKSKKRLSKKQINRKKRIRPAPELSTDKSSVPSREVKQEQAKSPAKSPYKKLDKSSDEPVKIPTTKPIKDKEPAKKPQVNESIWGKK